jgi:uncharacterized protein
MILHKREVHFTKRGGTTTGLDVLSSTLFVANPIVETIFSCAEDETKEEILGRLRKTGYKLQDSEEIISDLMEAELLSPNPDSPNHDESDDTVPENVLGGITLNISHLCNMNCGYCFGAGGSYGGPSTVMTMGVAEKAMEYLYSHCGNRKECMVGFFGGEPFTNWNILQKSILLSEEICSNRGIKTLYFITTNGTLITPKHLKFLEKFDTKLVISVDGPEFIHDKERKTKDGRGTYKTVKEKIQLVTNFPRIAVQGRPTVTPFASSFVLEIYHHLVRDLGITRVHARSQSACGTTRGLDPEETANFVLGIEEATDWMMSEISEGRTVGVINVLKYVNILYYRVVRHYHCGGGTSALSVAPDGSVYPCPRFTGEKDFFLGNIMDEVFASQRLRFFQNGVLRREGCRKCWARHICGGGCYYMHWKKNGLMGINDEEWCQLTRGQIDLAIATYSRILELPDGGNLFFSKFAPNLPSEFVEEK